MDDTRYTLVQRLLHWTVAVLVLGLLGVGMIFFFLDFEGIRNTFGREVTDALYTYHKTFGIVVLALMILRVGLRVAIGAPPHSPPLPRFQRVASHAVHGLLYVTLLAMPVVGWLATAAGGYPVQFFAWTLPGLVAKDEALAETLFWTHGLLGWVIIGLLVVHVGAALMHWLVKRDGVMRRMSLF